jgi:hypothetical protein
MYSENASFRLVFMQIPCKPSRSPWNELHTSRSIGTQMVGKMLRASSLHNPDEAKIRLGLIYKPHCNPNLGISCNKSTYQTELRTKVKVSTTTWIRKHCFCIKLLHVSAPVRNRWCTLNLSFLSKKSEFYVITTHSCLMMILWGWTM